MHGKGEKRKKSLLRRGKLGGEQSEDARRSHGTVGGRVGEVCCSIVAGVRWKKMFLEVGGPWEVDAGADLLTSAED